jgi:hypothetical protein
MIPEGHRQALDHQGFVQLTGVLPLSLCGRLLDRLEQLYAAEGDRRAASSGRSRARGGWPTWSTRICRAIRCSWTASITRRWCLTWRR